MQLNFKSFIDFGGPNRPNSMLGGRELWHPFLVLRYLFSTCHGECWRHFVCSATEWIRKCIL